MDETIESLQEQCKLLEDQVTEQQKVIDELRSKADYYDIVLQSGDLLSATAIAKEYGMSAKAFNKMLYEEGVQYKRGEIWFLYARYQNQGYMKGKTHIYSGTAQQHTKEHSYWTQKGRLFLYDFLKQRGILPLIESCASPKVLTPETSSDSCSGCGGNV